MGLDFVHTHKSSFCLCNNDGCGGFQKRRNSTVHIVEHHTIPTPGIMIWRGIKIRTQKSSCILPEVSSLATEQCTNQLVLALFGIGAGDLTRCTSTTIFVHTSYCKFITIWMRSTCFPSRQYRPNCHPSITCRTSSDVTCTKQYHSTTGTYRKYLYCIGYGLTRSSSDGH